MSDEYVMHGQIRSLGVFTHLAKPAKLRYTVVLSPAEGSIYYLASGDLYSMCSTQTDHSGFNFASFLVDVVGDEGEIIHSRSSCHWAISRPSIGDKNVPLYFSCLDLSLDVTPLNQTTVTSGEDNRLVWGTTNTTLEHLVRTCYRMRGMPAKQKFQTTTRLILTTSGGYLCRKDILELRMRHSRWIQSVISLPNADGYYPPCDGDKETDLQVLLSSSPGALLFKDQPAVLPRELIKSLDEDLNERLSFNWVLPAKPQPRKIAMIGGRSMFDINNMGFCYQGAYEAAEALGISVVVVDKPGHWLQDEAFSYLRDDFVAVDMTVDDRLPTRIADAIKDKDIDGIVAFADEFVGPTAQAAENLGLPTDSPSAFLQSLDKYATSKLFNSNAQALRLKNATQLDDPSTSPNFKNLRYPMIVKPCRGGGSRGVMKVNDQEGMHRAVRQIEEWGYSHQGILVETYADGPEVDANFALWEGEILFFEICDDFPSPADAQDAVSSDGFAEDNMVLPSCLSSEEKNLVCSSLHHALLQLGFRSGVFHVEARIQNSTMRYKETTGVIDLMPVDTESGMTEMPRQAEVFLVEVNPRPAGFDNVYASSYTYGVDFNGLHWLRALNDSKRFASLCQPFASGAQYFSCILEIPIHRDNIHVPEDFCAQVKRRLPEVTPFISKTECFTSGKIASPEGGAGFIGYFLVYSRISRRNLLDMCKSIREVSKDILDMA